MLDGNALGSEVFQKIQGYTQQIRDAASPEDAAQIAADMWKAICTEITDHIRENLEIVLNGSGTTVASSTISGLTGMQFPGPHLHDAGALLLSDPTLSGTISGVSNIK